jgi:hydroxymethylglutaryl-CoA lyase
MKTDHVTVFEVSPRDGLQSLALKVPTATKIALINALSRAGFRKIETTSFVSPRWVPQLGDAAQVMSDITRNPNTSYAALIPNERGLDDAIAAGCDEIAIFAAASEGFSRANLNCSIDQSFDRFVPILARARELNLPVRGYLSTIIACPFDGPTPPVEVARRVRQLINMGCYEVSLGDTIGAGNSETLSTLLDVLLDSISPNCLAGHFHDTNGRAPELVRLSLGRGIRTFDASVAGLGGCPYAPGASGNVATRAILNVIEEQGFDHGIDQDQLEQAEAIAAEILSLKTKSNLTAKTSP